MCQNESDNISMRKSRLLSQTDSEKNRCAHASERCLQMDKVDALLHGLRNRLAMWWYIMGCSQKKIKNVGSLTLTHTRSSWITYVSPVDSSIKQHGLIRLFLFLKSPSWVWHFPVPTSLVPALAILVVLVVLVYWCDWKLQTQAVARSPVRPCSDWLRSREFFCLCHCPHGETQVPPLPLKSQETPLTAVGCFDVSRISSFSSLVFFSLSLSFSLSVKLRV